MKFAAIFPGQGSQYVGMGVALKNTFPRAKQFFQSVDDHLSMNLSRLMFEGPESELTLTENTQPALVAVSLALMDVLENEVGLDISKFSFAAGHSLGEYSALAAAKVIFPLEAVSLVKLRGKAMQEAVPVGKGGMIALLKAEMEQIKKIVEAVAEIGPCVLANDNSPGQQVLSGEIKAIEAVPGVASELGVKRSVPLKVSAPFHSPLMEPAARVMADALSQVIFNVPCVPIVPNVTAEAEKEPSALRQNLIEQVCGCVRWRESMGYMAENGVDTMIEIGPGNVLSGLARRCVTDVKILSVESPEAIEELHKLMNE